MDKAEGFSACGGPLFAETRSALYDLAERPLLINVVYGLGGRDLSTDDLRHCTRGWSELHRPVRWTKFTPIWVSGRYNHGVSV